jgi:DNA-binding CsgD family transcriptional regulator
MGTRSPSDGTGLTNRQCEVIELLAEGFSNQEIADRLGISLDGAKWHVGEILGRLGVASRTDAAEWWLSRRRRRSRISVHGLAVAFAFPFKAAAALAGFLRPTPAVRIRDQPEQDDVHRPAVTERWQPPLQATLDLPISAARPKDSHMRDPAVVLCRWEAVMPAGPDDGRRNEERDEDP